MDLNKYTAVRHYEQNTAGRDFVVGDLHGCYDQLIDALAALQFDKTVDRLFSVGDLIDRGPKSAECLDLIFEPWFHAVRGNHEQMMIDAVLNGDSTYLWYGNGGIWAKDYDARELIAMTIPVANLPYVITVGSGSNRFNVLHAEVYKFMTLITDEMIDQLDLDNDQPMAQRVIWGRHLIYGKEQHPHHETEMSLTFVGHTPVRWPKICGRQVYIDGGCVYGVNSSTGTTERALWFAEPAANKLHKYQSPQDPVMSITLDSIRIP